MHVLRDAEFTWMKPPPDRYQLLSHVPQHMIGIPISRDGFHELIAEEDDDSIPLVLHHH